MADSIETLHKGRISGSRIGCPRMMGLILMGKERDPISPKLQMIFDEGQEHDEQMKMEAEEEFDDFIEPDPTIFKFKRGNIVAEVVLTPDGLRKDELIEFKGLSPTNFNAVRTEEDLRDGSPLFKKYYNQVQAYAGAFKKKKIRFRIKNKKNLKVKDIMVAPDPRVFDRIKETIMDVKEQVDKGKLPDASCSGKEQKFCSYSRACTEAKADSLNVEQPLPSPTKKKLMKMADEVIDLQISIDPIKQKIEELRGEIRGIMNRYGQRSITSGMAEVKYGIRFRTVNNKEDIAKLVESGKIRTEEVGSEYLSVAALKGGEE